MARNVKTIRQKVRNAAYGQAFARLDAALEENTPSDDFGRTELLGRHIFGDLWDEPEESGPVVMPK